MGYGTWRVPTTILPDSGFFIIVDLRINETLQTGAVRIPYLLFFHLVGTVSNCADAVRLETAPTGGRKCSFIFCIHYNFTLITRRLGIPDSNFIEGVRNGINRDFAYAQLA